MVKQNLATDYSTHLYSPHVLQIHTCLYDLYFVASAFVRYTKILVTRKKLLYEEEVYKEFFLSFFEPEQKKTSEVLLRQL